MDFKKIIPEEFYRGDNMPVVHNVGELKEQLSRLPDDLPLEAGFGDAVALVVFNINTTDCVHLQFGEACEYNYEYAQI